MALVMGCVYQGQAHLESVNMACQITEIVLEVNDEKITDRVVGCGNFVWLRRPSA
jgi:hypothetical protein